MWIAGYGPTALAVAGRVSDGVIIQLADPLIVQWIMDCTRRFVFFSSRRRHTRFDCDWSSDVCSSDLMAAASVTLTSSMARLRSGACGSALMRATLAALRVSGYVLGAGLPGRPQRRFAGSEERRVGEEGRSRWSPDH